MSSERRATPDLFVGLLRRGHQLLSLTIYLLHPLSQQSRIPAQTRSSLMQFRTELVVLLAVGPIVLVQQVGQTLVVSSELVVPILQGVDLVTTSRFFSKFSLQGLYPPLLRIGRRAQVSKLYDEVGNRVTESDEFLHRHASLPCEVVQVLLIEQSSCAHCTWKGFIQNTSEKC